MNTTVRRSFVILVVLLAVLYLAGGVSGARRLRSRIRAWLQPPTAAEMQRAAPDTVARLPAAPTRTPDGRKIRWSDPPSVAAILGVTGGVMALAVLLMFATARDAERRAEPPWREPGSAG